MSATCPACYDPMPVPGRLCRGCVSELPATRPSGTGPAPASAGTLALRYAAGESVADLASQLGWSRRAVAATLRAAGVKIRLAGPGSRAVLSAVDLAEIVASYRDGAAIDTLARRYATRYTRIRQILIDAGVTIRTPAHRLPRGRLTT